MKKVEAKGVACSTLASSPAFASSKDEASDQFGDGVQDCRTYEETSKA